MKSLILAVFFVLISSSLIATANASVVTTTTVTTTKYSCGKKHTTHHKKYKKYYSNRCNRGCDRVYYIDTSFSADYARYNGDYQPYTCVESDDPASCSQPQRDYPDSCFQCGS